MKREVGSKLKWPKRKSTHDQKGKEPAGLMEPLHKEKQVNTMHNSYKTAKHSGAIYETARRENSKDAKMQTASSRIPGSLLFDTDSTQIVNMALNLSESRKLASRRNMSNPIPPCLAPLSDNGPGGSLKQHLQQQRRTSRTVSPNHRTASGQVLPSLSVALENDPALYQYHFSQSTLARAQKAKDYFELMSQYRRLLEFIPPLNQSALSREVTSSSTPPTGNQISLQLGRPYNPLQYIRNRKVRQRERHIMDVDICGFSDVIKVSAWIDELARRTASHSDLDMDGQSLLPLSDRIVLKEGDSKDHISKPSVSNIKPWRPRIDWALDPIDMIADVVWLEQGNHKMLIEDRHWRRIFPQDSCLYYRPAFKQESEEKANIQVDLSTATESDDPDHLQNRVQQTKSKTKSADLPEPTSTQLPTSTRKRARNKLHDFKGKHRHNASIQNTDFLRFRREPLEGTSESESDGRKRRMRKGTITAHSKDALEKQMMDLLAQEAREKGFEPKMQGSELSRVTSEDVLNWRETGLKNRTGPPGKGHARIEPRLTDIGDVEEKVPISRFHSKNSSPAVSGRGSLDLPGHARVLSYDLETSQPASPALCTTGSRRGSGLIPPIGLDLSPPTSRPGSPARNPFSKVKHKIFRDRSRERPGEFKASEVEEGRPSVELEAEEPQRPSVERRWSVESPRASSPSPAQNLVGRGTGESHKGHSRIGSFRTRDEVGGPKGLFKNPRIDAIIRGSVSKVGDIIWRKGQYNLDSDSDTSTDDSDLEITLGRHKDSRSARDGSLNVPRHFLDVMPPFVPSGSRDNVTPTEERGGPASSSPPPLGPNPNQQMLEKLKPSRIDFQSFSPTATPSDYPRLRSRDSDIDTNTLVSRPASIAGNDRRASSHLDVPLDMPSLPSFPRPNRLSMTTIQSHPWSDSEPGQNLNSCLSRREVARMKALMLSTGIMALEISRRANIATALSSADDLPATEALANSNGMTWAAVAALAPTNKWSVPSEQKAANQVQLFNVAAQVLSASIAGSTNMFHASANTFVHATMPALRKRFEYIRERVSDDLSTQVRAASDSADGLGRDLVAGQRMKVKRVNDLMDKMQRRRRRRFRWLRRAGWLAVEWVLVGFMWYVWFVVVLVRIALGTVKGITNGIKWLFWLS